MEQLIAMGIPKWIITVIGIYIAIKLLKAGIKLIGFLILIALVIMFFLA